MVTRNIKIKGISQYGYSKFVEGQKTPKTKEQRMKNAFERVYRDEKGKLLIPGAQLKACLLHSALLNEYKIGKSKARAQELISALFQVKPGMIHVHNGHPLLDKDLIYNEAPTKVGQPPRQQMTMTGIYSLPEGWQCEFEVIVITNAIELDPLIEQLEFGGIICGIGGKRTWGWGRFEVFQSSKVR